MEFFNTFEVGKPYTPAFGRGEGARFGIGSDGVTLMYGFDRPTPAEVAATKAGQAFEIRFVTVGGIIWILSKCGNLSWVDSPCNPRLSSGILDPGSIADGEGLMLTLVMLDSRDAIVKSIRAIGLGTDFSRRFLAEVDKVRKQTMTVRDANMSIQAVMLAYPTERLVQMTRRENRFKL